MSTDLALNTTTHDLIIDNGDLSLVTDSDEVAQSVKIRLLFWQGEWILDYTMGVAYINGIYSISVSQEQKNQIIKNAILGTEHIKQIIQYSFGVDLGTQTADIEFIATDEWGDVVVEIRT